MESLRRLKYTRIRLVNQTIGFWKKKANHKFLFILCPPYCGSTALNEIISTSRSVSVNNPFGTREGQQLPEVRSIMFDGIDRWDEKLNFPWEEIKKVWIKYWDLSKSLLLEKSPPNIIRAYDIQKTFSPSYFVVMVRNPYAHVEGLTRRHPQDLDRAANFVIRCLYVQKKNLETLSNTLLITYEELTESSDEICKKLNYFLPELNDLKTTITLKAHNIQNRSMVLTNLNDTKIQKLSDHDLNTINAVFSRHTDILNYFGYSIIKV